MSNLPSILTFEEINIAVHQIDGQIWMTAGEIAKALGYSNKDQVLRLFSRNQDEFLPCMTRTVKLTVGVPQENQYRIFSLRGAHLLAMFSHTKKAKVFRKWVLDILDRETQSPGELVQNLHQLPVIDTDLLRQAIREELSGIAGQFSAALTYRSGEHEGDIKDVATSKQAGKLLSLMAEQSTRLSRLEALVEHQITLATDAVHSTLPQETAKEHAEKWARLLAKELGQEGVIVPTIEQSTVLLLAQELKQAKETAAFCQDRYNAMLANPEAYEAARTILQVAYGKGGRHV